MQEPHLDSRLSMVTRTLPIQTQFPSVLDNQARTQAHVHAPFHTYASVAANTYQETVFICASTPSCLRSRPLLHTEKHADQLRVNT